MKRLSKLNCDVSAHKCGEGDILLWNLNQEHSFSSKLKVFIADSELTLFCFQVYIGSDGMLLFEGSHVSSCAFERFGAVAFVKVHGDSTCVILWNDYRCQQNGKNASLLSVSMTIPTCCFALEQELCKSKVFVRFASVGGWLVHDTRKQSHAPVAM